MKRIQRNKGYLLSIFVYPLVLLTAVACHPIQKNDLELPFEPRAQNEKHFANGTTIGKYTYTDNEGNPIQVKYYADDSSYGVELKSIKVVESSDTPKKIEAESNPQPAAEPLNTITFPELQTDYKYTMDDFKNTYKVLDTEASKSNLFKANPDYEIFYQNELKGPQKCAKEKVHVYYDAKEKRKMRSVAKDLADADKFCEQF